MMETNGGPLDPSLYNADELQPPAWINDEFFETVLKTAKQGDIQKIVKYNIGPASLRGDHFASIMFRGVVQYLDKSNAKQEISLIIKTMPEVEGNKKELLTETSIFEVEIQMFRDIIPKFEKMLKSVGDNTKLAAEMLYYTLSPRKVIVIQDLSKMGYSSVGQRMCTMEEARMALEKLAKWHACSYVLNKETNGSLQKFVNGVFNLPTLESNVCFTKGTERLAQLARETPKLQKYADKLDQIKDLVLPKIRDVYEVCKKKTRVNVLGHGDFHAKNLMFKTNPKTKLSEEVFLVDFQVSIWCSMAIDLLYFIYMAIELESREKYFEELIYNFFCKFRETLKLLNYKGKLPKFSDLQYDMLTVRRIEIYLAATFFPFMVGFIENPHLEIDEIMSNADKQYDVLYRSQMYIDEIQIILERFLNRGYFESLLEDDDDD
ncbi:uncharacterized protein LOC129609147 [Condylostylus longicornis]|uniref:uncharacterized protein LOC129609147 n=1 Tax=Condylostylus longicornis TaxID=2530218 RepID=UPI00244E282C|nr:uncharacterized protein LOC129609147 [Condylostylus longicornis]